jgi:DNA-binding FadR family transcriptional regulator
MENSVSDLDLMSVKSGLSWQVARSLGAKIVNGEYQPGDSLPKEADLGTTYNVGRSAVREAIKMLASKGLVDARPRRGTIVCPGSDWNVLDADVLSWINDKGPDEVFLLELVEMRVAVETEASALAADRCVPQEVECIRLAFERMVAAADGLDDPIAADLAFHKAIVAASGNRFMKPLVAIVSSALRFSFRFTNEITGTIVGDLESHERILLAIEAGDAVEARQAVRDLLQSVRVAVAKSADRAANISEMKKNE